jgi:hypothetical protein
VPVVAALPWLLADPSGVVKALRYDGAPGLGGLSLLVQPSLARGWLLWRGEFVFSGATEVLLDLRAPILLALLSSLTIFMWRFRVTPLTGTVLLWLGVYAFAGNFFFQYAVWGLPFFLMAGYLRESAALQALLVGPSLLAYAAPWESDSVVLPYTLMMLSLVVVFVVALVTVGRSEMQRRRRSAFEGERL